MRTSELLNKVRLIEIKTRKLVNNLFSGEYHTAFKDLIRMFIISKSENFLYYDFFIYISSSKLYYFIFLLSKISRIFYYKSSIFDL